ncbi:hypothetical protein QR680_008422 [Steinernema hermaphroditum]|uniref:Palmitoyltransferase n=1 Tax=Steinernema hermaphroditum TaxID=289476 RepID=A0AA39M6Z7_9BILA|nr:hypothetical protein QR680_008422 [Steinernema hermaphroditum]
MDVCDKSGSMCPQPAEGEEEAEFFFDSPPTSSLTKIATIIFSYVERNNQLLASSAHSRNVGSSDHSGVASSAVSAFGRQRYASAGGRFGAEEELLRVKTSALAAPDASSATSVNLYLQNREFSSGGRNPYVVRNYQRNRYSYHLMKDDGSRFASAASTAGQSTSSQPQAQIQTSPGTGNGSQGAPNSSLPYDTGVGAVAGRRKWRLHTGKNRFLCNGRIMMAKQSSVFLITVFLIIFTMVLYYVCIAPYLAEKVTIALPLFSAFIVCIVFASLFKTSFTDPGIIPKATSLEVIQLEQSMNPNFVAPNSDRDFAAMQRTKTVVVNGQSIKLKYCYTCRLHRPPRSSHCSVCDNCILNFDHHCPWVGNCIGARNYRYFYFFITSLSCLILYVFGSTALQLVLVVQEYKGFIEAVKFSPLTIPVLLICFFSVWSICGLSGFHTYLLATNQTTNEDIKGTFNTKRRPAVKNPYSKGNVFLNCYHVLCLPELPSLIDRRGIVRPDPVVTVDVSSLRGNWTACATGLNSVDSRENMNADQASGSGSSEPDNATRSRPREEVPPPALPSAAGNPGSNHVSIEVER